MNHYSLVLPTINDEPEYRTAEELTVATYAITHSDMAGFCPWNPMTVATGCRISKRKLKSITAYFESIGKLIQRKDGLYIWWMSKIFHSLNKGRFSRDQLKNVQKTVKKWQNSGVFPENFAETVQNHYRTKYDIDLQVFVFQQPEGGRVCSESDTETESDTESETERKSARAINADSDSANVDNSDTEFIRTTGGHVRRTIPSGSVHRAVDYFLKTYQRKMGDQYAYLQGKDEQSLSAVVHAFGEEKTLKLIDLLFTTRHPFVVKTGRTTRVLATVANDLAMELNGKRVWETDSKPKHRQSVGNITGGSGDVDV